MPTKNDSTSSQRASQGKTGECRPLLDAATKNIFRHNAFRITGLPVDATAREIAKHAGNLKLMGELGEGAITHNGAFALDPPPTVDQVREAIHALKDPEHRLVDEFFWFWPREFGKGANDPALQALALGKLQEAYDIWGSYEDDPTDGVVATHNKALTTQIIALDWEMIRTERDVDQKRAEDIESYWRRSFKRWEKLVDNDRLWDRVALRVRQIDDPRLKTGFVRRMRTSLPEALDKINAELALSYAQADKLELAQLHIQFMRETNQGLDNVERTAELVLAPVRSRLEEQIKRAKEKLGRTPALGPQIAKLLLEEANRCVRLFDLFLTSHHEGRNDLFDEVASVCNLLVVAYHKTNQDDTTCQAILKTALPLATGMDLRALIEKNIGVFSGNIRLKEVDGIYMLLKSIQDSDVSPNAKLSRFEKEAVPAIMKAAGIVGEATSFVVRGGYSPRDIQLFNSVSVVLRGISIDAWNDEDDDKTALRAIDLALQYVRDAELKKRLQNDLQTLKQAIERKAAQEQAYRLAVERQVKERKRKQKVGWAVGAGIVGLLIIGSFSSNTSSSSSGSRTTSSPQPSSSAPNSYNYNYTTPSSSPNTYRVPSYMSSELSRDKQAIETQKLLLENLGREIDSARPYVDNTSEWSVQQFNAKVERYNSMKDTFNQMVDNYNDKLRRYGR